MRSDERGVGVFMWPVGLAYMIAVRQCLQEFQTGEWLQSSTSEMDERLMESHDPSCAVGDRIPKRWE